MDKWISVKDKLPKNDSDIFFLEVIVGGEEYSGFIPQTGYYLDDKFYDDYDHEHGTCEKFNTRVTHWLPQPKYPDIKNI